MATFRYHLRKSKKTDSEQGRLYIRVIKSRVVKNIATPYSIFQSEWDEKRGKILYHDSDPARNNYLAEVEKIMRNTISILEIQQKQLLKKGDFTTEELIQAYRLTFLDGNNIITFCEKTSRKLSESGQGRTARAYRSAVRSLLGFLNGQPISMEDIDQGMIRDYEAYLKKNKLEMNTISFYIRNIRALYYRAVAEKIILPKADNPFQGVYTGVHISKKRALTQDELKALRSMQGKLAASASKGSLREQRKNSKLRDSLKLFEFCLEGRGISWVDLAMLKKTDLKKDEFTYRRQKTGRPLDIFITRNMQRIIKHFAEQTQNSPYVFPIIDPAKGNEYRQSESGLRIQNERLGILAEMAGIAKKVTSHVSRHTWATIARNNSVSIAVISDMLGHSNINVIIRYLDSIENDLMKRVTRQVTKALGKAA